MYDKDLAIVQVFPAAEEAMLYSREAADARLNAEPVVDLEPERQRRYDFAQAKAAGSACPTRKTPWPTPWKTSSCRGPASSRFWTTPAFLVVARRRERPAQGGRGGGSTGRLGDKANVLILRLECAPATAATTSAWDLAQFIAGLKDRADKPVKTIAYVTPSSRDVAVFLALACDQIVLQKDARLGDFDNYLRAYPDRAQDLRRELREIAEREFYPPLLAEAMADRDDRIVEAESTKEQPAGSIS